MVTLKGTSKNGQIILEQPYPAFITGQLAINEIEILYPRISHWNALSQLPFHHRDPFDRLEIKPKLIEIA